MPSAEILMLRDKIISNLKLERHLDILETGYIETSEKLDLQNILLNLDCSLFRTNISGDNIDFQWNLEKPIPDSSPRKKYDIIFCLSVMEHVKKPWLACEQLEEALNPGGLLLWSTPWVHRIHGYPDDYWRFSPSAIESLFTKIEWLNSWFFHNAGIFPINDKFFEPRILIEEPQIALDSKLLSIKFDFRNAQKGDNTYKTASNYFNHFKRKKGSQWLPASGIFYLGEKRSS